MANTFNRRPSLVNLPNADVMSNSFFTHSNWSGVNENRNVLNVDQQSFIDASNVWVDAKGVLCSRPTVKVYSKNVLDVFMFDNIKVSVTKTVDGDKVRIRIYNDYADGYKDITLDEYNGYTIIPWRSKLLMWDNITKGLEYVYDTRTNKMLSLQDLIYVPVKEIVHNNVVENFESLNALTESYKTRYLLDTATNVSQLDDLIGKNVDVTIGDDAYSTRFKEDTIDVLAGKYCKINDNVINSSFFGGHEVPLIDVSDNGVMLICEYERRNNSDHYKMYFTTDGMNLNYIMPISNMINRPRITRDGHHVIAFTDDGAYILTIIPTNISDETFEQWTNILEYNGYLDKIHFNYTDGDFHQNTLIDGYFIDPFNFIISWAQSDSEHNYKHHWVRTIICENGAADEVYCWATGDEVSGGYVNQNFGIKTVCKYFNNKFITATMFSIIDKADPNSVKAAINFTGPDYENNALVKYVDTSIKDYCMNYNLNCTDFHLTYSSGAGVGLSLCISKHNGIPGIRRITAMAKGGILYMSSIGNDADVSIIRDNGMNITDGSVYFNGRLTDLLKPGIPVALLSNNVHFTIVGDWIYSNAALANVNSYVDVTTDGSLINLLPEHFVNADALYISNDNNTYIASDVEDKLYFPLTNRKTHDFKILNLHKISDDAVAVFFNDKIDYIVKNDNEYYYYRSRLPIGLLRDSDVITINDGKYTLFPSERGLAVMGYQDFVATSEQSVKYLTDDIADRWEKFSKAGNVKILHNKFWAFIYNGTNEILVLDIRNNSLWPWTVPVAINKMYYDSVIHIVNQNDLRLTYDGNYADVIDNETYRVSWFMESQKLHFDAPNHYKHIINFTFNSLSDRKSPMYLKLDIKNYRKRVDDGKPELFEYVIDVIRTFVKRVNYAKVCEFQYKIGSDDDVYTNIPFEASAIIIKYKITGQVR